MRHLLDLPTAEFREWLAAVGQPTYRESQVRGWIMERRAVSFDDMTDLPAKLRQQLAAEFTLWTAKVARHSQSDDGTEKLLLELADGGRIECVLLRDGPRRSICISSQVGCAMGCVFCASGLDGVDRNLTTGEILEQALLLQRLLPTDERLSHIVVMGMGEPLANFDNVVSAMQLMLDDHAYGISRRRLTLSTSGIVPAMDRLRDACPVALAVSLHAPNDALRDELVPINRKYPIRELMAACVRYIEKAPRDFVTFEYVLLAGINDSVAQARDLVQTVKHVHCKINLIPFNPFPGSGYERSAIPAIAAFRDVLHQAGLTTTVRKTRGDTIDAACGQLAGQVRDKTRRVQRRLEESRT